jgi:hypothetical protein
MFAEKLVVLFCVAISIVTNDAVINVKRWGNQEECGATDLSIYKNSIHHGQWPFVASIYYVNNDRIRFICGGTIISKFAVMTGE